MVLQARLRIRHHGCVSEKTVDGARIVHVSGDGRHCLSIFKANSAAQLDELLTGSRRMLEPEGVIDRADDWAVVRCHCPVEGSRIMPIIEGAGCTLVWPVIEAEGHEHYTVLAPSRSVLGTLVARLREQGDVEVERASKVAGPALDVHVPLADLTQEMTRRQLDVLRLAVASGYYDAPRRAHAEDLAATMGMSRSTLQEHLQKAESSVMKTFASLLLDHPALADQATKGRGRPRVALHKTL